LAKQFKKFYRINQYIQADKVRVVDDKGTQVGIMDLREALQKASDLKIDLIEIAGRANPPVCKLIDFKKFKYLEAKKAQEEKKKNKKSELKEIRLTLFIAENDLNFRAKHAQKFLEEGHKVKISLKFKGRQNIRRDLGQKLLQKVIERLSPYSKVDTDLKNIGNRLEAILVPVKTNKNEDEKEKTKN